MEKKTGLVLILSVLLTLSLGSLVSAAQLSVPSDYSTIQAAVDAAADGDKIIVESGTYEESVSIKGKSNLTIEGQEGAQIKGSILVAGKPGNPTENVSISGLSISNDVIPSVSGHGIRVRGMVSGLEIVNNNITNCRNNGIDVSGNTAMEELSIEGNNISENGKDGVNLTKGREVTIANNTVEDNGQTDARGTGIRVGGTATDVLVEDNEISGNAFANIHPQSS